MCTPAYAPVCLYEVRHPLLFTARPYARAVYAMALSLSVRPSVRPSQASIVPKRLNMGSPKQRHTIARDSSFLMPKISGKFE